MRFGDSEQRPDGLTVVVRPALMVRVHAVDAQDRAVFGVEVRTAYGRATTDAKGDAMLEVPSSARTQREIAVFAELGLDDAPRVAFAPGAPPEPIRLQVPPTGLLRVIAYGVDEQPRTDVSDVLVTRASLTTTERAQRNPERGIHGHGEPSGAVVRVPLGGRFRVALQLPGVSGPVAVECDGPTRANELVICPVRPAQGPPLVAFTVRGRDGQPIRGGRFTGMVGERSVAVESDPQGRVVVVLAEAANERTLHLRAIGAVGESLGAARIALPAVHPGENVLPDVVLADEPLCLAGDVVDATGKPVADATVSARLEPIGHITARTDAAGHFELRSSDATTAQLTVIALASEPKLGRATATFPAGTQGARLTLRADVEVRIVAVGLPTPPHDLLTFYVLADDGTPMAADLQGDTATTRLPAGDYVIAPSLGQPDEAPVRLPLHVAAEAAPIIVPFAWREHFLSLTATVVTPDGKAVPGLQVFSLAASNSAMTGITADDGTVTLLVPRTGGHLLVRETPAFGRADRADVHGDVTLTVAPSLPVAITFAGLHDLPKRIQPELYLGQQALVAMRVQPGNGDLRATGFVPTAGHYDVLLRFRLPSANGDRAGSLVIGSVDVPADGDHPIVLTWSKRLAEQIADLDAQAREAEPAPTRR